MQCSASKEQCQTFLPLQKSRFEIKFHMLWSSPDIQYHFPCSIQKTCSIDMKLRFEEKCYAFQENCCTNVISDSYLVGQSEHFLHDYSMYVMGGGLRGTSSAILLYYISSFTTFWGGLKMPLVTSYSFQGEGGAVVKSKLDSRERNFPAL